MRKFIFTLLVVLSFGTFGMAQNVIEPELQNVMNQKGDEMKQCAIYEDNQGKETGIHIDESIELTDNITMVDADKVWDLGYTGKGVVVAVIDSGVNYNHADLADHLWDGGAQYPNHGYNVVNDNNDPMDDFGRGTHCAGTVCGDGTSGQHTQHVVRYHERKCQRKDLIT